MSALIELRSYLFRYRVAIIGGFLFLILANIVALIQPYLIRLAVDSLQIGADGVARRGGERARAGTASRAAQCRRLADLTHDRSMADQLRQWAADIEADIRRLQAERASTQESMDQPTDLNPQRS